MGHPVLTNIVRIGNSRGLRIPKAVIEQLDLGDRVAMSVQGNQLVIRSARKPHEGWEEQFRLMHERGDDRPVDDFPATIWEEQERDW